MFFVGRSKGRERVGEVDGGENTGIYAADAAKDYRLSATFAAKCADTWAMFYLNTPASYLSSRISAAVFRTR